jgi:hypothetical protein
LRKITGGSSGGGLRPQSELTTDEGQALWIYLECANCGEHIKLRLRKTSEIQRRDGLEKDEGPGEFFIRKTIIGSRCYKPMEAEIEFDNRYRIIKSTVKNGKLIPRSEYNEEQ